MINGSSQVFNLVMNYCESGRSRCEKPEGSEADIHRALSQVQKIRVSSLRDRALGLIARTFISLAKYYEYPATRDQQRADLYYSLAITEAAERISDPVYYDEIMEEILVAGS